MAPALGPRSVYSGALTKRAALRLPLSVAATLAACVGLLSGNAAQGAGPVVGWGRGLTPNITATAIAAGGSHTLALPEPSFGFSLVSGMALLAVLKVRSQRQRSS